MKMTCDTKMIIFIGIVLILLLLLIIWLFSGSNNVATSIPLPLSETELIPYCACQYTDIENSTGDMSLIVKNDKNLNCSDVCTDKSVLNTKYNYCNNIEGELGATPIDCSSFEFYTLPNSYNNFNISTFNVYKYIDNNENWYRNYITSNVEMEDKNWILNDKIHVMKNNKAPILNNYELKELYLYSTDPSQPFSHSYISTSFTSPNHELNHFGSPKSFYVYQHK